MLQRQLCDPADLIAIGHPAVCPHAMSFPERPEKVRTRDIVVNADLVASAGYGPILCGGSAELKALRGPPRSFRERNVE
jgi:hypothetical protein